MISTPIVTPLPQTPAPHLCTPIFPAPLTPSLHPSTLPYMPASFLFSCLHPSSFPCIPTALPTPQHTSPYPSILSPSQKLFLPSQCHSPHPSPAGEPAPSPPYHFSPCWTPSCRHSGGSGGCGQGREWGTAFQGCPRRHTPASPAGRSWTPAGQGRARCLQGVGGQWGVRAAPCSPHSPPNPVIPPQPLTLDLEVGGQQADVGHSDVSRVPVIELHQHGLGVLLLLVAGGACGTAGLLGWARDPRHRPPHRLTPPSLTSYHIPRVEAPGFLAPVGTDAGAGWKAPAGLRPNVEDLRGAACQGLWGPGPPP